MLKKVIALVLLFVVSFSYATDNDPKKITSVEGITEYQLDNGLKVLLFPDKSVQTITVNVTYLVGSRHEGYGETGMAHLLEHLVFKGSPKHKDIPKELSSHGARPNGTTWYDRTNYFETFSANAENLDWALDMEADRMVNSFISKEDLESEFSVVRNEFESGENQPAGILLERVLATSYIWHNYGNTTIGAKSDIEKVPIDNLKAFYTKYYQPDNAILLVAGNFDPEKTLKLVQTKFGIITKPSRKLQQTHTDEPAQDGERVVHLKRVGDAKHFGMAYHMPSGAHADHPPLSILEEILTDAPSGRLYKALIESKKGTGMWSFMPFLKEPGFLYINVDALKEKSLDDIYTASGDVLGNLTKQPITQKELDNAKNKILKNIDQAIRNSERLGLFLSEYIAAGDWRLIFLYRDAIEKVTLEDVQRVASTYFKDSNRTIGYFTPEKEADRVEIPASPDISALVANYKGRAAVAEGEDFDNSYDNITKRTFIGKLDSGIEYALIPKKTRGNTVQASLVLRFGDENSLKNKRVAASYTARMLNKGTKDKNREQIESELDKLKSSVRISGSSNRLLADITSTKENFIATLNLVSEMLKKPSFDENEFSKLIAESLSGIEQSKSDPIALAQKKMTQVTNNYEKDHPFYNPTFEEQEAEIKALTMDELKAYHKEFYGVAYGTFSVIGDFEKTEIEGWLQKELNDWKSNNKYERIRIMYYDYPKVDEKILTPDKKNAIIFGTTNFKLKDSDDDYAAMIIGNTILGGGFLNSRIADRLRQKDGLSYGAGSFFNAGSFESNGSLGFYAIYAPQNLEKVELGAKEEVARLIKDGITAEELKNAVNGWVQQQSVSRSKDDELRRTLGSDLYLDRDMKFHADLETKVKKLTIEDVNNVLKKYIDPSKFSIIKAGDFK
ncbi:pitrilysin family protein [Aquimarina sp. AU474]|uniref:M16 family metallopeptidase n=1 Tax=Aquimarina sp. AU474 TaxID=2108529 RepID=UPI000D68E220|nr:pitrilysin family protein [Aquimarina sp. AU474]